MTVVPDYHDSLSVANPKRGQLPFYVLDIAIDSLLTMHHHDYAELYFVYEGKGTEVINGKKHVVQPGSASFLLPHHLHEIRGSAESPIRMYCCMFDISVLFGSRFDYELAGKLLQCGDALPSYVTFGEDQAEYLKGVFSTIFREYHSSHFAKFSLIRIKLLEALHLFVRAALPRSCEAVEEPKVIGKTFAEILQYVHLHYTDKLTLELLSGRFQVSPPYISHSFKKFCGQSFLEYVHMLRINNAQSLLASTDMPISDVAVEVGFDSYRNFSRVFRKKKGMTPGEFRSRYQGAVPVAAARGGASDDPSPVHP
jgi:AraC-type DNA-binding domain-containing proteins